MATAEIKQVKLTKEKLIAALLPLIGAILFMVSRGNSNSKTPSRISQPINNPTPPSTLSIPANPEADTPAKPEPYQLQPSQLETLKSMLEILLKSAFKDWKSGVAITQIAENLLKTQEKGKLLNNIAFVGQIAGEYANEIVTIPDEQVLKLITYIIQDPTLRAEFERFIEELFTAIMMM